MKKNENLSYVNSNPGRSKLMRSARLPISQQQARKTLAAAAMLALAAGPLNPLAATAGTYTFSNASSSTDFNLSTNWTPGSIPGSGDVALFGADPTSATAGIGFDFGTNAAQSLGEIAVSGRSNALIIGNGSSTSGTLTLNGVGGTILSNAGSITLTLQNYQGSNSSATMGIVLGNTTNNITENANGTIVISSTISEANPGSSITFGGTSGAPKLVLNASNSYSGGTTVNLGAVLLGNPFALGSGTVTINNFDGIQFVSGLGTASFGALAGNAQISLSDAGSATVNLTIGTANVNSSYSGAITGKGMLTKVGSGVQTLTAVASNSGGTTIDGGTLQLGTGGSLANQPVTFANTAGADFDVNGQTTTVSAITGGGSAGGNITLGSGTLTVDANSVTNFYSGTISGTGTFVKNGSAVLRLTGASTYSGATYLNNGELSPDGPSVGTVGAITSGPFGTGPLNITGGILSNPYILGAGAVQILNPINLSGSIQIGNYQDGTNLTWSGPVTLLGASTLAVRGGGGGSLSVPQGQLAITGNITGTGSVTLLYGESPTILSGSNSYSGATILNPGLLLAGSTSGLSPNSAFSLTQTNAILELAGYSNTIGSLASTAGTVENNSSTPATLTVGNDNTSTTVATAIQDYPVYQPVGTAPLSITKIGSGTMVLTGTSTYSGVTTINGGTLTINASTNTGASLKNSKTLAINPASTANSTLSLISVAASGSTVTLLNSGSTLEITTAGAYQGMINLSFTDNTVKQVVQLFEINGVAQPVGIYNATSSVVPADDVFFSGTGSISVAPEPASWSILAAGGLMLRRRRRMERTADCVYPE